VSHIDGVNGQDVTRRRVKPQLPGPDEEIEIPSLDAAVMAYVSGEEDDRPTYTGGLLTAQPARRGAERRLRPFGFLEPSRGRA
jgi:hypothetical protein